VKVLKGKVFTPKESLTRQKNVKISELEITGNKHKTHGK
jgi:hypothetical protein